MKHLRVFSSVEERAEVLAAAGISILSYTTGDGIDSYTYIPPSRMIVYTSTDGNIVAPSGTAFGVNIVSNTYSYEKGVIVFDGNVTSIGTSAFNSCTNLASIIIPNKVETIGSGAFMNCSGLTSVTIPNSVTTIGGQVFQNCRGLTSVTIPNSVKIINNSTFMNCTSLTSVTIPNSVTTIGSNAFWNCSSLTSVTIPDSVTDIGGAFCKCASLESVIIGSSVTIIRMSALRECGSLESVTVRATTPPTLERDVFTDSGNNFQIYVPSSSVSTYKSTSGWSTYASRIQAIP